MNHTWKIIALAIVVTITGKTQCSHFHSIIVPGQNGEGGQNFSKDCVVNTRTKVNYGTLDHRTHRGKVDFGQVNCIRRFEGEYGSDVDACSGNNILFGISQGAATLVNSLARKSHQEQEGMAKGLVLESALGHGNSAIMHRLSNKPRLAAITYLPFARIWIPWVAKLAAFPAYNPYGMQAISSAQQLSPNLPIIIMHDQHDPCLSINDARAFYCTLKSRKGDQHNVYLMELANQEGVGRHLDLLTGEPLHQKALQVIYKKHHLPYSDSYDSIDGIDLTPYQPSVKEVRARITKSTRCSFWTRNTIDILTATTIIGAVYLKYFRER